MEIYYSMLFVITFLLLLSRISKDKYNGFIKQIYFIIFALLIVVLVAGLRWNVGTDFLMYNAFFNKYRNNFVFDMRIEPIFKLFCFIPGQFFEKSTVTFILIAIYTYCLVFIFCKKNCKYYDLAFFLFISMGFYFTSLNIVRQWMAIPAILLSYNYIAESKYLKALLFFVLAYFCHYTSIIIVPILFFIKIIKSEKIRFIIIGLAIMIYLISDNIMPLIQNLFLNINFLNKYYYYFSKINSMNATLIIPSICLLVYFYYIIFLKKHFNQNSSNSLKIKKLNVYINILIFAFVFTLLGTKIDVFERVQHFFYPIVIVIIPMVLEIMNNKKNKKIITFFILLLGLLFFTNTMRNNGGDILPYKTIITEVE